MTDFNEKMARLDGWIISVQGRYCKIVNGIETRYDVAPDYYNDLNLLIPLAFKHGIAIGPFLITKKGIEDWYADKIDIQDGPMATNKDPVQAIRECLLEIYKEKYGDD